MPPLHQAKPTCLPGTDDVSGAGLRSELVRHTLRSGGFSARVWLAWGNAILLIVGGVGLWSPTYQISLWLSEGNTPKDAADQAMGGAVQMQVETAEPEPPQPKPVEQPPTPVPPEPMPVVDNTPEPQEAVLPLTENAIFPIPTAPPLVNPLPLKEEPHKPRPKLAAHPAAAAGTSTPTTTAATPNPGGSSGAAQGMQTGGAGAKGHFPAPPYPASARRRGAQGSVSVAISVDATGTVTSVRILSTSGFADLDTYVCDWIQSRWHWPAGEPNVYRQPVLFKLR